MNFELSDEQRLLQEAARDALSRIDTVAAAREALDGSSLPDMWPTAVAAGWPGLMVAEEHDGAGLGALEAMLVMWECGRSLAPVPLLGHLIGTSVLESPSTNGEVPELPALAAGEKRIVTCAAMPPGDLSDAWTTDPRQGRRRATPPGISSAETIEGDAWFVPDAPEADLVLTVTVTDSGVPVAVLLDGSAVQIDPIERFDATRPLAHIDFGGCPGRPITGSPADLAGAWHLGQALIAAESLGTAETALEMAVAYAKERQAFGRVIGSYQAIKHQLVEILRLLENARSVVYYAGWAYASRPDEFALAANAARVAAGAAVDYATRTMIAVHGGIGATWEHDAHLYFRRAQLSRRLLGGVDACSDRVAGELIAQARVEHAGKG